MSVLTKLQKLERIAEGWTNVVFLSETVEVIARQRAISCAACEFAVESSWMTNVGDDIKEIQGLKCDKCNCPLSAKTRSINEKCPLPDPKW